MPNLASLISQEYPKGSVRSRVAAFERQYPVLQSISKPSWITAERQRSTTDAVLSWLNAGRRTGTVPVGPEANAGTLGLLHNTFHNDKLQLPVSEHDMDWYAVMHQFHDLVLTDPRNFVCTVTSCRFCNREVCSAKGTIFVVIILILLVNQHIQQSQIGGPGWW